MNKYTPTDKGEKITFRIHRKNPSIFLKKLKSNDKLFAIDKTSTGKVNILQGGKEFYFRDKIFGNSIRTKIAQFQSNVSKSKIYNTLYQKTDEELDIESDFIRKSILYKGFLFKPEEREIKGVLRVDLSSAYWRTSRILKLIDYEFCKKIEKQIAKPNRLFITGSLGRSKYRTQYQGDRKLERSKMLYDGHKRFVFRNIYERIKKYVDEVMIWAYKQNPNNFIGYYTDGFWIYEFDDKVISEIRKKFPFTQKTLRVVDLVTISDKFGNLNIVENSLDNSIPYDVKFKHNLFVNYIPLYDFAENLTPKNGYLPIVDEVYPELYLELKQRRELRATKLKQKLKQNGI